MLANTGWPVQCPQMVVVIVVVVAWINEMLRILSAACTDLWKSSRSRLREIACNTDISVTCCDNSRRVLWPTWQWEHIWYSSSNTAWWQQFHHCCCCSGMCWYILWFGSVPSVMSVITISERNSEANFFWWIEFQHTSKSATCLNFFSASYA